MRWNGGVRQSLRLLSPATSKPAHDPGGPLGRRHRRRALGPGQRLWRAVAAALVLAVVPTLAYLALSWMHTLRQENRYLRSVAAAALAQAEVAYHRVEELLNDLDAAARADPFCSQDHVTRLREIKAALPSAQRVLARVGPWIGCTDWGAQEIRWFLEPGRWHDADGLAIVPPAMAMGVARGGLLIGRGEHAVVLDPEQLTAIGRTLPTDQSLIINYAGLAQPLLVVHPPRAAKARWRWLAPSGHLMAAAVSTDSPIQALVEEPVDTLFEDWLAAEWWVLTLGLTSALAIGALVLVLTRPPPSLESQLKRAIRDGKLIAEYLPLIDLATGRCVGAEALARWHRGNGDRIEPDLFIPAAERDALTHLITEHMLGRVVEELGDLLRDHPELSVSINLAPQELHDDRILAVMRCALAGRDIHPRQITLEVTERTLIDVEAARAVIQGLRAEGHAIAIDDYGTGYSGLYYLQTFDLDQLKIAKLFVDAIGTDAVTSNVVPHIVALARTLDVTVVAEGVECAAQADYLRAAGVRFAQGWLFGRPMAAAELAALIALDSGSRAGRVAADRTPAA